MAYLSDFNRLVRIDEKIAQLEREYQDAVEAELERGGKHFLLSRSLEHSLLLHKRKRANLERILVHPVEKGRTFSVILEKRKKEAQEVEKKIRETSARMQGVALSMVVNPDNKEYRRNYSRLGQEMIRLEKRLAVKEAAIEKWLGVDVDNIKPISKAKIVFEREYQDIPAQKEYKNPLENDPRWLPQKSLDTQAIIEPRHVSSYALNDEELAQEYAKIEKESDIINTVLNAPTQSKESDIPSSSAVRIELEEREQLDAPQFQAQRKRIVIE